MDAFYVPEHMIRDPSYFEILERINKLNIIIAEKNHRVKDLEGQVAILSQQANMRRCKTVTITVG